MVKRSGFALIEVLVALMIVAVLAAGMYVVANRSASKWQQLSPVPTTVLTPTTKASVPTKPKAATIPTVVSHQTQGKVSFEISPGAGKTLSVSVRVPQGTTFSNGKGLAGINTAVFNFDVGTLTYWTFYEIFPRGDFKAVSDPIATEGLGPVRRILTKPYSDTTKSDAVYYYTNGNISNEACPFQGDFILDPPCGSVVITVDLNNDGQGDTYFLAECATESSEGVNICDEILKTTAVSAADD